MNRKGIFDMASMIQRGRPKISDIEAKRLYDEYRRMKLLLEYVRQPDIEKVLEDIQGSSSTVPQRIRRSG
jgi:hypothetical protein